MNKISKFHYITQEINGFTHAQLADFACCGGADWVQLRVKNKSFDEWLKIAEETKLMCKKHNAKLIINDNVLIAKKIDADGVHLGKNDMKPSEARKILGKKCIIGGTANSMKDIRWLMVERVDYIGLGPFRFTNTKENLSPILGLGGIKNSLENCKKEKINIPIIAIGGIKKEDIETIVNTEIYGIAISSAINFSENKTVETKMILELLERKKGQY